LRDLSLKGALCLADSAISPNYSDGRQFTIKSRRPRRAFLLAFGGSGRRSQQASPYAEAVSVHKAKFLDLR